MSKENDPLVVVTKWKYFRSHIVINFQPPPPTRILHSYKLHVLERYRRLKFYIRRRAFYLSKKHKKPQYRKRYLKHNSILNVVACEIFELFMKIADDRTVLEYVEIL
jgi:hypothetical protein